MSEVTTYNPRKVICTLANHIVTGWAEDSFITVDPLGEGVSSVTGCGGDVARSIDPNRQYSIKLSLLQSSPTNEFLLNMYKKDQNDGDALFPVLIKDLRGKDQFSALAAWVVKPASYAKAKAAGNREWELQTGEAELS